MFEEFDPKGSLVRDTIKSVVELPQWNRLQDLGFHIDDVEIILRDRLHSTNVNIWEHLNFKVSGTLFGRDVHYTPEGFQVLKDAKLVGDGGGGIVYDFSIGFNSTSHISAIAMSRHLWNQNRDNREKRKIPKESYLLDNGFKFEKAFNITSSFKVLFNVALDWLLDHIEDLNIRYKELGITIDTKDNPIIRDKLIDDDTDRAMEDLW
jgi:hypothetical protein